MLCHLFIRNLALIDQLEMHFDSGFTILTGETGAGKSILIDAIGLVLGARGDATLVRAKAKQAEVTAEFALADDAAAQQWVKAHALEDDEDTGHCLLRRVVLSNGRTRAFINDRAVSVSALRELGGQLVEIFGQGESRTVAQAAVQRSLLDASGDYQQTLQAVVEAAHECERLHSEIQRLRETASRDPEQIDYLRFQIEELQTLAPTTGEAETLAQEQRRLAHADELINEGNNAHATLYGGDSSVYDRLTAAHGNLVRLARLHPKLEDAAALVSDAQSLIHEAADTLQATLDQADVDPTRLQEVEARMARLHDMARKHHIETAELPTRLEQLENELAGLESASRALEGLRKQHETALATYRSAATRLTAARQTAANTLAERVSTQIRALAMPDALFRITVAPQPEAPPSVYGADQVRFDFTANAGQAPQPLAKVASGGELSRISLALQVTVQRESARRSMIFDEVDAGIGGPVAETVGERLAVLGTHAQVLCVTHLAQVAAQGDHHFLIRKQTQAGQTHTGATPLDADARVRELARMVGGHKITPATEAHARELLGQKAS